VMAMLMRTDPFQQLERLNRRVFGTGGAWSAPAALPIGAYRAGDEFVVHLDLPGVDPSAIEVNVERNVLSVKAERRPVVQEHAETVVAERPYGVFSRQLFLGDALDAEHVEADYDAGVLTVRIQVAAQAKPRKIEISAGPSR
jgi:HSP20 family protein